MLNNKKLSKMNNTYKVENLRESFKTTSNKAEAVKAAKEISKRRRISVTVYAVNTFGAVRIICVYADGQIVND